MCQGCGEAGESEASESVVVGTGVRVASPVPVLHESWFMFASPMTFGQANRGVVGLVAEEVMRLLGSDSKSKVESVLELYSGAGTLTIPLALSRRFARITAVEMSEQACDMARSAVREQQLGHVEIVWSDVGVGVAQLRRQQERFDAVVVNPPWHGLCKDVRQMLSGPQFREMRHMVYVSCNPLTLARDVAHLELLGWRADSVTPFDMMPQTREVEVVAHLRRVPRRLVEAPAPLWRSERARVIEARPHEFADGASGLRLLSEVPDEVPEAQTWSVLVRGRLGRPEVLKVHAQSSRLEPVRSFARATLLRVEGALGAAAVVKSLSYRNHPVVGVSADRDTRQYYRLQHGLDRPFLHCSALTFGGQVWHSQHASLAPDLELVLQSLSQNQADKV